MTWPDVFRWLTLTIGVVASIAGLAWTLGRIFRPWMRAAAQDAADGLYERLKNNDFRHIEDGMKALGERIERVDTRIESVDTRIESVEARIGARIDRMGGRIDRMGGRIESVEARIGARIDRMGGRMKSMEARILAAVQRRGDMDNSESGP